MEKIYKYRLHGIDLIEKSLFQSVVEENTQFNFSVNTQGAIDSNRKIIVIVVEVIVRKLNENEIAGKFLAIFGFELQDFETILDKNKDGLFILPIVLENTLKSISISTMRGIIFSELRGTPLHNAIMPIIPMDSLKPTNQDIFGEMKEKIVKKK